MSVLNMALLSAILTVADTSLEGLLVELCLLLLKDGLCLCIENNLRFAKFLAASENSRQNLVPVEPTSPDL